MRAAAIDYFGRPEVLTLHVLPVPAIDPDEVLIAVHTAGVGSWDADMREGWVPDGRRPRFPLVLGTDGSGTIAAIGSRVRRFSPGDTVYAYSFANPKGGFYAEYVAVTAEHVGRAPKNLTPTEAGAVATTGLTALQGVDDVLRIRRGEAVVIHGASGGVGTLAVQFAKLRGARVLATASGTQGMALVRRLGADAIADARHDDLKAEALEFAGKGVDAVLAFAGGLYAHAAPRRRQARWARGVSKRHRTRAAQTARPVDEVVRRDAWRPRIRTVRSSHSGGAAQSTNRRSRTLWKKPRKRMNGSPSIICSARLCCACAVDSPTPGIRRRSRCR